MGLNRMSKVPVEAKTSDSVSFESTSQHGAGHRHTSLLEGLYGVASEVFRDLGGGEAFLRKEREELRFRAEGGKTQGAEPL